VPSFADEEGNRLILPECKGWILTWPDWVLHAHVTERWPAIREVFRDASKHCGHDVRSLCELWESERRMKEGHVVAQGSLVLGQNFSQ